MHLWVGGLIFSFIILALLTLWSLIDAKGRLLFKVIVISLVLGYALVLSMSIPKLQGWATDEPFPDSGAYLISFQVVEPGTSKTVSPGIYLWVVPNIRIDQDRFGRLFLRLQMEPRVYKIPYQEQDHKRLAEQQKRQAESGGLIFLKRQKGKGTRLGHGTKLYSDDQLEYKFISPHDLLKKAQGG